MEVLATIFIFMLAFIIIFVIPAIPIALIMLAVRKSQDKKRKTSIQQQNIKQPLPVYQNNKQINTPQPIHTSADDIKGSFGEYCLYQDLKEMPGEKKILTNCYIPKSDGTTTEIDLVMIHETGIYVIESKNYSGWIFGTDNNQQWTQTFPNGKKFSFYNPIKQNLNHINNLKALIGCDIPYFSFVVFGDDCELKNITNKTKTVVATTSTFKRILELTLTASNPCLDHKKINEILIKLSDYEYATKEEKLQHINNIKGDVNG